jgi:hypothetical protein
VEDQDAIDIAVGESHALTAKIGAVFRSLLRRPSWEDGVMDYY